ncbi:MAG: cytochrome o ubiquinol oxidase subunit IV [Gammaproteobacteria bacterium]|nr:MAG: cytochrome o ubiquinol oxidase subunit IV [Gammaproteobacteria bacterium]
MSQQHGAGGEAHGSVKEYVTGLILSIILTVVPFGLVIYGQQADSQVSSSAVMVVIIACAIAQLLVQGIFFLHMNGHSSQMWNTTSAVYIIFTVLFFVVGTIWIFGHLNHNMLMGH